MKTPPLLLFASLLFWGWQSHLLWEGAVAGVILELPRLTKARWDLDDADFHRIWTFCALVIVVIAGYIFTTNEQGSGFSMMFRGGVAGLRKATDSSNIAATSVLRWLPLIFFPFVAAQAYNVRSSVPLTAVSLVLRFRRRRGEQSLAGRYVDISYSYFILSIFSAGIHTNTYQQTYFWGLAVLILWALWALRSRRHGFKSWALGLAVVMSLGFAGQFGIGQLEVFLQNFNARWMARFMHTKVDPTRSITSLGQIGEMKLSNRILIRLEPSRVGEAPNYLHEASYRKYNPETRTWSTAGSINDFYAIQPQGDNSTWLLLSNHNARSSVTIACYLEGSSEGVPQGVLPLPSGTSQLENMPGGSLTIQTNQTGVVLATGLGLMIFDARYGPGPVLDTAPGEGTNKLDSVVPPSEIPALDQVIAEMNLSSNLTVLEKRVAIAGFFARNFTYSTWQGADKLATAKATPLTRFLLTSRSGHCEYFATATVLLLRQLKIPARYAVGYAVHETSGSGYVVRERDAHAWCLAWNDETKTWDDFDTTPASWVAIEGRNGSIFQSLSDLRSWLWFQFEKVRWRQAQLRQYILWTMVPVIVVLVYYIIFQHRAKHRAMPKKIVEGPLVWPGHDSAFYRLEQALAARGLPREPAETLSAWLGRVLQEPALASQRAPLRALLQLHYRYRFDPLGLDDTEKQSLIQNAEIILTALAQLPAVAEEKQ